MQMIADLHTHTLCATHAYNTFTEMAAAAKEIGYCALAVTDHAPAMPDSPHAWHFQNWSAMPREIGGVVMLYGAEANVMDTKGGLDLSESQLKAQDWVVASIHSSCVPGLLTRREANRLWLAVAETPMSTSSVTPSRKTTTMTTTLSRRHLPEITRSWS